MVSMMFKKMGVFLKVFQRMKKQENKTKNNLT